MPSFKLQYGKDDIMKNFYIEISKEGHVRYRMSYKDPLTNRIRRVTVTYDYDSVRNRRKAQEELELKIKSIYRGFDIEAVTLEQACKDYYAHMKTVLKGSSCRRNETVINIIKKKFPDGTLLCNITPAIMRECLLDVSKGKPVTYNEYLKRLKTFWKWAYQNDYVLNNAIVDKLASMPDDTKRERIADKYLETDEIAKVLDGMVGMTQYQLITRFLILSGLRIGEALALTWKDIDRYIHVTKTLDPELLICTSTKTFASTRDVYIQDELKAVIDDLRKYNEWFECIGIDSELLFPWKDGTYMHYDAYRKYLRETCERTINRQITPHALRHTHVSLLAAAGVPLEAISRRVGHEGSHITKRIYLHVMEKRKKEEENMLQSMKLL